MILVEDGYTFIELVNFAYNDIKNAIDRCGYDLFNDFVDDRNYSEICDWCSFPDLQTDESIYERAINNAIYHLMIFYNVDCKLIQKFVTENIVKSWDCAPISQKYESYSNGDEMCMFINDKQINIPKDFYRAIKQGKL